MPVSRTVLLQVSELWVLDRRAGKKRRLWNIFPTTSGMLLHCLQPHLADSGFPGLVPHHNKSRSCSHPCPPRGTNLNQELLGKKRSWSCVLSHRKCSHVLELAGFSLILCFLLMLDPCAQPDSWLWETETSLLPAQKSNCFQFTQTTTLGSAGPSVDDFQLKFPISGHQRMQTKQLHMSLCCSCTLLCPCLVLFGTMSTCINLRSIFVMNMRLPGTSPKT